MSIDNLTKEYFIRAKGGEYEVVDKATYVQHERAAGFYPEHGEPDSEACTGAFSSSDYRFEGRIDYK